MNPIKYTWMCINNTLTRNQNPIQKLEGASRELDAMLNETKLGLVNMVKVRNITQNQVNTIQVDNDDLVLKINASLNGDDEATKMFIRQKIHLEKAMVRYKGQLDSLRPKIEAMVNTIKELEFQCQCFKTDKMMLESDYKVSKSINGINKSSSGLSNNVDIGVVDEIRNKINDFNAESDAISELTESGILKNQLVTSNNVDESEVDAELNRLKNTNEE